MDWNPKAPNFIGNEAATKIRAGGQPVMPIGSQLVGVAERVDSTVTQTIDGILQFIVGQAPNAFYMMDGLISGSEVPANRVTTVIRPNASVQAGTSWQNQAASQIGANLYLSIDEAVLDTTDYVGNGDREQGINPSFSLEFATAGLLTGKRITAVRLCMYGIEISTSGWGASELTVGIAGVQAVSRRGVFASSDEANPALGVIDFGELYTPSNQPWTVAQLQALDTSAARISINNYGFFPSGPDNGQFIIYQAWLEVDSCDENRHFSQIVQAVPATQSWIVSIPRKPDGTANWAKVSGTDVTVLARQVRQGHTGVQYANANRVGVPYTPVLDDQPPVVASGAVSVYPSVVLNADGTVASLGTAATDRIIGVAERIVTTGLGSVDGVPYSVLSEPVINASAGVMQQEISGASAQSYAGVWLPLLLDDSTGTMADLTVQLRRRSDSALLATATITKALAESFPVESTLRQWRRVQAPFAAPVTLAAATQYYLQISSTGAGSWRLQALGSITTTPASSAFGEPTYGGLTDVATLSGVDQTRYDIAALVYKEPAIPTNFAALATTLAVDPDASGISQIPGVRLAWTVVVNSTFGYYEIQRMDAYTGWATIKAIATIATNTWTDWEPRAALTASYRMRHVDAVGVASSWTSTKTAVPVPGGCGLYFTANQGDTSDFVAFSESFPGRAERDWQFPEATAVQYVRLYGRRMPAAFRPTERDGVRFTRSLLIHGANAPEAPAEPGVRVFDAIRDLAAADLPYVCVRDELGNRWFASITVPEGRDVEPGRIYFASLSVVEIAEPDEPA